MLSPLLTIVVPTYNRAECLSLLLTTLTAELQGLNDKVMVIIGDNASTDHTPTVTNGFLTANPTAKILRHSVNLGPDENFSTCIDNVLSRFFWIISDDDLPKFGVIRHIVQLLDDDVPDLLYLNSEWLPHLTGPTNGKPVPNLSANLLSRAEFARKVNFGVTFITGMVVNLERLRELNPEFRSRQFAGTNLVQLGWVLPLLMAGSRLQLIEQRCVLATSGNSGGYKLFTVFGTNFPKILDIACGPTSVVYKIIMKFLIWSQIPSLLWLNRFGKLGTFNEENILLSLAPLRKTLAYWIIMRPIIHFPRFFASIAWFFSKIIIRIFNIKFILLRKI